MTFKLLSEPTTQQAIVKELQRRCAGAHSIKQPTNVDDKSKPGLTLFQQLDMLWPMVRALYLCRLVREVLVLFVGLTCLISAGWFYFGSEASLHGLVLFLVGSFLMAFCLIKGIPGGVTHMEVTTKAGFHFNESEDNAKRNSTIRQALQGLAARLPPCPWLCSGELCTVLPFIWSRNRGHGLEYERVWLKASDGEHFACDWVFPPSGYNPNEPVVILLPGLAPDTHWRESGGFFNDAAWHLSIRKGMTVVCLVARGTMGTEVDKEYFNAARVTDLRDAVLLTEAVLASASGSNQCTPPPIFGAGFSMGGIVLANYCGQYGKDARLKGAINFSAIYDMHHNATMNFEYSLRVWQAYLAYGYKQNFLNERLAQECKTRRVDVALLLSGQTANMKDIDREFLTPYNGYACFRDYYTAVGVAGDVGQEKWKNVAIPLLAVIARDDPITHPDSMHANEFSAGNDNMLFLVTERGGHVGWPLGWMPWQRGFDFQNETIDVFIRSVQSSGDLENKSRLTKARRP